MWGWGKEYRDVLESWRMCKKGGGESCVELELGMMGRRKELGMLTI